MLDVNWDQILTTALQIDIGAIVSAFMVIIRELKKKHKKELNGIKAELALIYSKLEELSPQKAQEEIEDE